MDNAKKKFTATFKDGTTVTRSSHHDYKTAWRSVDYALTPPRIIDQGFSSKSDPSGVRYNYGGMAYLSANQREIEKKKLVVKNAQVRTEVVPAIRVG